MTALSVCSLFFDNKDKKESQTSQPMFTCIDTNTAVNVWPWLVRTVIAFVSVVTSGATDMIKSLMQRPDEVSKLHLQSQQMSACHSCWAVTSQTLDNHCIIWLYYSNCRLSYYGNPADGKLSVCDTNDCRLGQSQLTDTTQPFYLISGDSSPQNYVLYISYSPWDVLNWRIVFSFQHSSTVNKWFQKCVLFDGRL